MTIPADSPFAAEVDWHRARAETIRHLQQMLRVNTVNPPGNELQLASYVERVLRDEGIETRLFEPAPGRGAVVARLRGGGGATRAPVLMMAHMDVVGIERDRWSVDPFGGEIVDGYLYGRGAIDDKGMLAANLMTMLLLKRQTAAPGGGGGGGGGRTLSRDVVFVANSDEEAGGEWGMGWLIDNHPDLIRAEFALNEGGRTRIVDGRPLYIAIQNAEKVSHVVTLIARGPEGHASVPIEGNAIVRLGRALGIIGAFRAPTRLLPTTRRFFEQLSVVWPRADEGAAMAHLVSGDADRMAHGARVLARIPVFDAVLRTGVSAVLVSGGIRTNVIPSEATATLNVRTLPGERVDEVVEALQRAVGDPQVEFCVTHRGDDTPASDFDSAMFSALAASAKALDPALAVVPYLSTGATDSARLRKWGVQAYGILPFPMDQNDEERMHGHDERIALDALEFGTRLIYGAIVRVAT